jgi:hypothetical protein
VRERHQDATILQRYGQSAGHSGRRETTPRYIISCCEARVRRDARRDRNPDLAASPEVVEYEPFLLIIGECPGPGLLERAMGAENGDGAENAAKEEEGVHRLLGCGPERLLLDSSLRRGGYPPLVASA